MTTPENLAGSKKKILVVDDDEDIRNLLSFQLKIAGYEVTGVSNGFSALNAIKSQPYDLLITDAMMPQMSGYDLVQVVRAAGILTPIVMLTALDTEQDALMAFRNGVDHFENKPYTIGPLLANVARLLADNHPAPAAVPPVAPVPPPNPRSGLTGKLVSGNSGLPGLDKVLGGKWPAGSNILVIGEFGSGKSTFGRRYLVEGLRNGEPAMMITVDDNPVSIRNELNSLSGGKLDDYEQTDKFRLVDASSWSSGVGSTKERFAISGRLELTGLAGAIIDAGSELGQTTSVKAGGRRVLDSITSLFVYFDLPSVQRFLMQMARTATSYGEVSTLFLLEQGAVDDRTLNNLKYFMDGIFEFRAEPRMEMRVANLKWQEHSKDWFPIKYSS
ncbi:MAG: response regulator [Chloroflexi bacterium]|nr:response regulator [Chloroflexota bacterium]OJW02678.1 MAG: hypothetical protein BGO39_05440 [Chloroflexi bacterium 54-19]